MKSIRSRSFIDIAVVAFSVVFVCQNAAQAADMYEIKNGKIGHLLRPTLGAPAIVKRGETFDLKLDGKAALESIQSVSLDGNSNVALSVENGAQSGDSGAMIVRVPADAKVGLYDLRVSFMEEGGAKAEETQPHALKIVDAFPTEFQFAIVTDIHFGDVRGETFAPGKDFYALRRNILKAASAKNPDFILLTGDLTDLPNGYREDYEAAWSYFRDYCTVPIFAVPGNHDKYIVKTTTIKDGKEFWAAFFGERYYAFDYGQLRFIGLDDYEWPSTFRKLQNIALMNETGSINHGNMSSTEFDWLKQTLAGAQGRPIMAFAHLPLGEMLGGEPFGDEGKKLPGVPKDEILRALENAGVRWLFVGHWHRNRTTKYGQITEIMTNTAGSDLYSDARWGFNLVTVKDGAVANVEYFEVGFD